MSEQRKIVTSLPENSETPLEDIKSWVTPNRLFFVRNHFPVPQMKLDDWQLRIEGLVESPMVLSWHDLASLPQRSVFATMECAGNGRSFLQPRVAGVPWGAGAIGHAEWSGVPLKHVLQKVGLRKGALEVVFEGSDRGTEPDHPEVMPFARSLPMDMALHPDTLLATHMNGEVLDDIHGYPVRLLVPGWYGVASVKWLRRIELIDYKFQGYFQTVKYTVQRKTAAGLETVVVGPMAVKSEIIRPAAGELLGIGTNRIFGVAWAGQEKITGVEVSTDGGKTWTEAERVGPQAENSWTMWEYLWEVAREGDYVVLARATSSSGQVQPEQHDNLNGGYQINFSRPTHVRVASTRRVHDQRASGAVIFYDMNAFAERNTRLPLDVELEFSGGEGI